MGRKITSKMELTAEIKEFRRQLEKKFSFLTPAQLTWPGSMGEWSVKDILAHLVDWEQRFIGWYRAGLKGEVPETPAPGMRWRDLPELNQQGYLAHKNDSLAEVLKRSSASHHEILSLVEGMTGEEIFIPQTYSWTGNSALVSWITANTSSHYRWAMRNIRTRSIKSGCPVDNVDQIRHI